MFYILVMVLSVFAGVLVGTGNEMPLTINQITEANARCAINADLDHINVRSGRATAYCANGAVFILKEK